MTAEVDLDQGQRNWKTPVLAVGAVLGAVVGLVGAYLLIQNAEKHGRELSVTAGDGVKLSLLLMGTLRQVAQLGDGE